jgi:hypothetical protein
LNNKKPGFLAGLFVASHMKRPKASRRIDDPLIADHPHPDASNARRDPPSIVHPIICTAARNGRCAAGAQPRSR